MDKEQIKAISESIPMEKRFSVEQIVSAAIASYKAELLKEVGEPIYQVCKSDSISLSSAWIDVTEQTYNDAGLYPEYGRRILYTSDQVAAAIIKATGPLEEEIDRLNTLMLERNQGYFQQLKAAQEEIERLKDGAVCGDCDGSGWLENRVDGRYPCTCMTEAEPYQLLHDQLAKAEQRVAEACALQVATETKFHWLDAARVAKEIRSGEWRKFVKEV